MRVSRLLSNFIHVSNLNSIHEIISISQSSYRIVINIKKDVEIEATFTDYFIYIHMSLYILNRSVFEMQF